MNLFPFSMVPLRPSVSYILLRTAVWWIPYYFSIPPIFLVHPMLIVLNLLILMAFFYHFFLLCSELYIVSPDMLMVSTGLANKTVKWLDPLQVKEFKVHQTKLMRYFKISHVTIMSEDDVYISFTLKGIKLDALTEALRQTVELLKARQEHVKLVVKLMDLADTLIEARGK